MTSAPDRKAREPDEFGLVQVWWGDGKGKTTASLGMGFRAAGHGYRVHLLQFMKGGAPTVDDVRGEYASVEAVPGFSYENAGEYGWHGFGASSEGDDHEAHARAALARARELLSTPEEPVLDAPPDDGVHMLILDEILYAANRGLIPTEEVVSLTEEAPDGLELVLTGGHERPGYACEAADLVSHVGKETHPMDAGQPARRGTEY